MSKKIVLSAVLCAAAAGVFAAPEITISSSPALPTKNLVATSDFSQGLLGSWGRNAAKNSDLISIDKTDGIGDKFSLKITGDPARSPNAYHRLRGTVPMKSGEPYLVRYYSKRVGSNVKLRNGSAMAFMPVGEKKYLYSPMPEHIAGDCDWAEYSYCGKFTKDSVYGTLYMCYYKQTGYTLFDNVEFRYGLTDLNISVKGGGLQEITVRNSVIGTIFKEKIKGSEYNKKIKGPAFGSYSVEVLDRTGEVTSKLYPATEDANVAASDTVVPLTPIKRVIIPGKGKEEFPFALPAFSGKKVYLQFTGRLHKKGGIAGYSPAVRININAKSLGVNNVVKPAQRIVLIGSPKKRENIYNSKGLIMFYSNTFAPIPKHNRYHPTSFAGASPFEYKLDITSFVAEGLNTLSLYANDFKNNDIYIDNLRVVIE